MRRLVLVAISALAVPAIVTLASADASKEAATVPDAAPDTAVVTPPRAAADPPPLVERRQWIFDLRWDRGDVFLVGVHPLELGAPQATPRVMGRFAIELSDGQGLVERVRFDFPLLGTSSPDGGRDAFTAKLRTRIGVIFPATSRGTKLELVDRSTGERWRLPWPPTGPDGGS